MNQKCFNKVMLKKCILYINNIEFVIKVSRFFWLSPVSFNNVGPALTLLRIFS